MSASNNNIETILKEIVIKNSSLSIRSVTDGDRLESDLGFDSLAFLMTLTDLEDKFNVQFAVERIDEFRDLSFRDLVRLVTKAMPRASQHS